MKSLQKRITRSLILGLIILAMLGSMSIASPIKKSIDVIYNSVNITVNGDGASTDNLLYQATTYVPLRAVSEILGKEVDWDGDTKTASINDSDVEIQRSNTINTKENISKTKKNIEVTYNSVKARVQQARCGG